MFSFAQIITVSSFALAAAASPLGNGLIRRADTNITGSPEAVPNKCVSACDSYVTTVSSCLGETIADYYNQSYVGPDLTNSQASCLCGDNVCSYLSNCVACTQNNADAGTNATFLAYAATALDGFNGACILATQSGYINGTWTNTTLNFTGGLHGKGNAVGSGVSRRTEFMFGATGLGLVGAIIAVLA